MATPLTVHLNVDLEPWLDDEIACEMRGERYRGWHPSTATWHVLGECPGCGTRRHVLVCGRCRDVLTGGAPLRCSKCNYSGASKKVFTKTIQL